MELQLIDWLIIAGFFILSMAIGLYVSKSAGKSSTDYFLSGRSMPWWLLGMSMVATTFSADTPNLVTDLVRGKGVSGNWAWWAYLLTGMVTVFVYAKLWRRSGMVTDLEFYEKRYSGPPAAFLRGFRAIYLGVVFNVIVMATVFLAGIKMGGIMLNLTPLQTILLTGVVTAIYSTLGGLKGILLTDFFQFILAMVGTIWAAYYIVGLPEINGLENLLSHPNVVDKLDLIPRVSNTELLISAFIIPLAVQWWASYYPGAEPGGGGYIVQRMLAAKNEKHAVGATLFFNIVHYAARPWPWIIIALASLIVFPNVESIGQAFPQVNENILKDDLAYPAMLTFLPTGLLGLVIASLIAALMSTISTQVNWGSSYIVNDFYVRFIKPDASEKNLVVVGRISTVLLMILAGALALYLQNAKQAFDLILAVGAGTGLIYILRWFWWRINAYSEIAGMVASVIVAGILQFNFAHIPAHYRFLIIVAITTTVWLIVTYLTRPTDNKVLKEFYEEIKPHRLGWEAVVEKNDLHHVQKTGRSLGVELLYSFLGVLMVYGFLFGIGYFIYGNVLLALSLILVALIILFTIFRSWNRFF